MWLIAYVGMKYRTLLKTFFIATTFGLNADIVHAAHAGGTDTALTEPLTILFVLIGVSLLPLLGIMCTSFAKIVIVLSIARQAIGTPSAPPNLVIVSLSLILTAFSMQAVFREMYVAVESKNIKQINSADTFFASINAAKPALVTHLKKYADPKDIKLFARLAHGAGSLQTNADDDLIILAPAFMISELSKAFQIGFLIFLPFVIIDMAVANILMALGMQMLAPTTISLPFKLLLFVLVDGWRLLAEGLVKG